MSKSNKSWDNDWLIFSRKSRRGVFVLLGIFIAVAVMPRVYRNYFMQDDLNLEYANLLLKTDKDTLNYSSQKKYYSAQGENSRKAGSSYESREFSYKIPAEPFDPNLYSFEEWRAIGFSEKQVQTIFNYIDKGGSFRVKSDIKKLYVIDEDLYLQLKPLIILPDTLEKKQFSENSDIMNSFESKDKKITLNINTASAEELKQISGIGPFFAKEIIKLRESHGGIHNFDQLLLIYNMDEEKISKIGPSLFILEKDIRKININTATRKELAGHPSIDWNVANSIVSLRENHGKYNELDDLLKSVLIDQKKLEELKPYLIIE